MLDEPICQRLLCLFGGILLYTERSRSLAGVALDYSGLLDKNLAPKNFNLYLPNNFDCKSWGLTAAMQLKNLLPLRMQLL